MANLDFFVGREDEINDIVEIVQAGKEPQIILIGGKGGVGKSFLINKLFQDFQGQADFHLDFFDSQEQPLDVFWQALHLASSIGIDYFPKFNAYVQRMTTGELDITDLEPTDIENPLVESLIGELLEMAGNNPGTKFLRILDTFETIPLQLLDKFDLSKNFSQLDIPITFLFAGRQMEERVPFFVEKFGEGRVHFIELEGFDKQEATDFFNQADEMHVILDDLRDNLYLLSQKRPIMLSLAIEWIEQEVPLPEIVESKIDTGDAETVKKLQERFEFELVSSVRKLRTPLDLATLYISHVHQRVDADVIKVLLDIEDDDLAADIFQKIRNLAYIRDVTGSTSQRCAIHDEMKVLVDKHVWPLIDETGEQRKRLTRKIINKYYDSEIVKVEEKIRTQSGIQSSSIPVGITSRLDWRLWRLEKEKLSYLLSIDIEEGNYYFNRVYSKALRNNHIWSMKFLISEMEQAGIGETKIDLRTAEMNRRLGNMDMAEALCKKIIKQKGVELEDRVNALNILGTIYSTADPVSAENHYLQALELNKDSDNPGLNARLHSNLGRLYKSMSRLEHAENHFGSAIEFSQAAGNRNLMASTMNNQAYVYRLQGKLMLASTTCDVALAERKTLGETVGIAYSYLTKAEIERDLGAIDSAEHYTRLALETFEQVDDLNGKAQCYRSLANINRHLEDFSRAEAYLVNALDLAESIDDIQLQASLYHIFGRLKRHKANFTLNDSPVSLADSKVKAAKLFKQAGEYLEKSIALAEKFGDDWLIARSLLEKMLIILISDGKLDEALAEKITNYGIKLDDYILLGYVHENRGMFAYQNRDFSTAGKEFGLAAQHILKRAGREPRRFYTRTSDRLTDDQLLPTEKLEICSVLSETLSVGETNEMELYKSLQQLCDQMIRVQKMVMK